MPQHETSEQLYKMLLSSNDCAVICIDTRGKVVSWNAGATHIFQYKPAEILGKSVACLYRQSKIEETVAGIYREKAANREQQENEGWMFTKTGLSFFAKSIAAPFFNPDETPNGFALIIRDITDQKRLAQENKLLHDRLEDKVRQRTKELEVVNNELEAFSYSVSHDLRTPLRAISGYSSILKEDCASVLDGEGNRIVDLILANTKMMSELIDDLLTFSRMARLETIHDEVKMEDLVQICLNDFGDTFNRHDVSFGPLPPCSGDPAMLKQVWVNLLSNAFKYTSKNEAPKIEISASSSSLFHIYSIRDNGVGFDMKYAHKLFGVFQRLHRQDEFEGTGLGLALAKRIVSKHGGEIWAEAMLDQGAAFSFSIPKNKK